MLKLTQRKQQKVSVCVGFAATVGEGYCWPITQKEAAGRECVQDEVRIGKERPHKGKHGRK